MFSTIWWIKMIVTHGHSPDLFQPDIPTNNYPGHYPPEIPGHFSRRIPPGKSRLSVTAACEFISLYLTILPVGVVSAPAELVYLPVIHRCSRRASERQGLHYTTVAHLYNVAGRWHSNRRTDSASCWLLYHTDCRSSRSCTDHFALFTSTIQLNCISFTRSYSSHTQTHILVIWEYPFSITDDRRNECVYSSKNDRKKQ